MKPDLIEALPGDLLANVRSMCGRRGEDWLLSLSDVIADLEQHWDITVGPVFPASGANYVAPARNSDGELFVLKVAPPYDNPEWTTEATYLRMRNANGCVRLIAEAAPHRAMLIERAVPGESMDVIFADRESECVTPAIELLRQLTTETKVPNAETINLDEWFENLRRSDGTGFPGGYATKALNIYERLGGSQRIYLHGDFHPRNIVSSDRAPFLVIDPKGLAGDPGYDIGVFLNNFHWWQRNKADIHERLTNAVRQFADGFGMSEREVREWAFVQMVVSAWWTYDELPDQYTNEVADADVWSV